MSSPECMTQGTILAVSVSRRKGIKKNNVPEALLLPEHGLEGDAHAGDWHRQVSLLDIQSINKIRKAGVDVSPGDFAENLTTQGLRLWELPLGTRLEIGPQAEAEVTQIGKECHTKCAIFRQVGDCVMPREGIFAKIIKAGRVKPGDRIRASV